MTALNFYVSVYSRRTSIIKTYRHSIPVSFYKEIMENMNVTNFTAGIISSYND
jgi:hypothetical protein